jgi:hypothetical protein
MTEQSKGSGFRFGAIMTLVPLVSAAFGGLQYYRDQQQREFEVVTFYLQNQDTFDPCSDAQFANLNLGMIENIYPRVYAKVVEHVENRASQCDSVTVIAQEQAPAAANSGAQTPASTAPMGEMQTRSIQIPLPPNAADTPPPAQRVQVPVSPQDVSAFFRNRYDRLAALPGASARRVQEGRYRILIQISDESDRALAQSIEAALSGKGSATTPSIDLVPVNIEKAELRYFREAQAADAQRLADEIEQAMAAAGSPGEVTATHVDRAGLPPGVMELWLP